MAFDCSCRVFTLFKESKRLVEESGLELNRVVDDKEVLVEADLHVESPGQPIGTYVAEFDDWFVVCAHKDDGKFHIDVYSAEHKSVMRDVVVTDAPPIAYSMEEYFAVLVTKEGTKPSDGKTVWRSLVDGEVVYDVHAANIYQEDYVDAAGRFPDPSKGSLCGMQGGVYIGGHENRLVVPVKLLPLIDEVLASVGGSRENAVSWTYPPVCKLQQRIDVAVTVSTPVHVDPAAVASATPRGEVTSGMGAGASASAGASATTATAGVEHACVYHTYVFVMTVVASKTTPSA